WRGEQGPAMLPRVLLFCLPLACGMAAVPAAAAPRKPKAPQRAPRKPREEVLDFRCAYCPREAITTVVVNGGAPPARPRPPQCEDATADPEPLPPLEDPGAVAPRDPLRPPVTTLTPFSLPALQPNRAPAPGELDLFPGLVPAVPLKFAPLPPITLPRLAPARGRRSHPPVLPPADGLFPAAPPEAGNPPGPTQTGVRPRAPESGPHGAGGPADRAARAP